MMRLTLLDSAEGGEMNMRSVPAASSHLMSCGVFLFFSPLLVLCCFPVSLSFSLFPFDEEGKGVRLLRLLQTADASHTEDLKDEEEG